jgi:hypothetical protein
MPEFWLSLLPFVLCVIVLYWLQRWISQHMQGIGLLLFGSSGAGMALLWFALFPGIILHEASHWIMARLLGLKTGRFRVWPQTRGKEIVLGSVEVQRGGALRDSLVGLAPFLAGTLALLFVGTVVFDARAIGQAWEQFAWDRLFELLRGTFQVANAFVWLYLIFAVSNAMMPSPSDRESWRLVLIYLAVVVGVMAVLGWIPVLPDALVATLADGLRTLTYAFGLTLLFDIGFALLLFIVELVLSALRRRRIMYK